MFDGQIAVSGEQAHVEVLRGMLVQTVCQCLGRGERGLGVFAGGDADLVVHGPGAHLPVGLKLAHLAPWQPDGVFEGLDSEVVMGTGADAISTLKAVQARMRSGT